MRPNCKVKWYPQVIGLDFRPTGNRQRAGRVAAVCRRHLRLGDPVRAARASKQSAGRTSRYEGTPGRSFSAKASLLLGLFLMVALTIFSSSLVLPSRCRAASSFLTVSCPPRPRRDRVLVVHWAAATTVMKNWLPSGVGLATDSPCRARKGAIVCNIRLEFAVILVAGATRAGAERIAALRHDPGITRWNSVLS